MAFHENSGSPLRSASMTRACPCFCIATQQDLFLAILALDSYNRGYERGMDLPANSQSGDATVVLQADSDANQAAGFFALAYAWEARLLFLIGEQGSGGTNLGDVRNGWF